MIRLSTFPSYTLSGSAESGLLLAKVCRIERLVFTEILNMNMIYSKWLSWILLSLGFGSSA
jgi:hypothetical protein